MEPHPVPRQITTFEFKLIGFLTLRQFVYLAIFIPLAVVFYYLVPLPFFNLLFAFTSVIVGLAIAFVPYNERPLDIWVKNFLKKLFSPSQYYYLKKNQPPTFLKDIFISSSPKIIETHIIANQKLASYLSKKQPLSQENQKKHQIHQLISSPLTSKSQSKTGIEKSLEKTVQSPLSSIPETRLEQKPFLFGSVKNSKNFPLANVLIYIKKKTGENVRILKTNHQGFFATFRPFPPDVYVFEAKDLGGKFFFDTMEVKVSQKNDQPINFISKELL